MLQFTPIRWCREAQRLKKRFSYDFLFCCSLSLYQSVCLSVCLSVWVSVCLSVDLSVDLLVDLSVDRSIFQNKPLEKSNTSK